MTGWEVGYDQIGIAGTLRTLVDDLSGSTSAIAWAVNTTADFANSDEAAFITLASDAALTNLTTVASNIALVANGGGAGIVLAQGTAQSALYVYQDTADTSAVTANELQLLAVFDSASIGTSDVVLS